MGYEDCVRVGESFSSRRQLWDYPLAVLVGGRVCWDYLRAVAGRVSPPTPLLGILSLAALRLSYTASVWVRYSLGDICPHLARIKAVCYTA